MSNDKVKKKEIVKEKKINNAKKEKKSIKKIAKIIAIICLIIILIELIVMFVMHQIRETFCKSKESLQKFRFFFRGLGKPLFNLPVSLFEKGTTD